MKKIISNTYANFYLNAAESLGLRYIILNDKLGLARIYTSLKTLNIGANILDVNSQLSSSLSTNKVKTSTLLQEENIPVPSFEVFSDKKLALKYCLNQLHQKRSIVIKPISGSLSFGITVDPKNKVQSVKAIKEAFEGNSSIMIEEYIAGNHYRITVFEDEVIAVTQRIGAYIIGDGSHSIDELIKIKNQMRDSVGLPQIQIRNKDADYIRNQDITSTHILPKNVPLSLQLGCDLDIGGERRKINIKKIPIKNVKLFKKAVDTLGLKFAGIDYISPDIQVPYTKTVSAINEINSAPDSDVHFRDSFPHSNYAAERILINFFSKSDVDNFTFDKKNPYSLADEVIN